MTEEEIKSLPARGAWVETRPTTASGQSCASRSPQGERGLKPDKPVDLTGEGSRSPQGERGLKLARAWLEGTNDYVAPRKGSVG